MTQRGNEIMTHVIVSAFALVWLTISFFLVDIMCIGDVFDDFRRNDYQGVIVAEEFFVWVFHYFVICGLIGFFGIYMRNMITNILGIVWMYSLWGLTIKNYALFQPYFFTTWEGALFLVDIGARVLVLLIAIVGIAVTCRSWYRWYKKRKLEQ